MRLVGILLLHLCFFLLGGQGNAHASTHDYKTYYSRAQQTQKALQALNIGAKHDYQLDKNDGLPDEDTYLISVDDDDNEEEDIRKPVFQARDLLAFFCTFVLYHHYSFRADSLSFCEPSSSKGTPKYISQRVLRI